MTSSCYSSLFLLTSIVAAAILIQLCVTTATHAVPIHRPDLQQQQHLRRHINNNEEPFYPPHNLGKKSKPLFSQQQQQHPHPHQHLTVTDKKQLKSHNTNDNGKNNNDDKKKNEKKTTLEVGDGDDPWSWSGSSWSMSSASSSTSSGSGVTPNPVPPLPPWPTPAPGPSGSGSGSSSSSTTPAPSPTPTGSSGSGSTSGGSSSSSSGSHAGMHKFMIYNNCTEAIWVAVLGNPGFAVIAEGGFVMARAGPPKVLWIPVGWQGRIWARIGCKFNASGTCDNAYQPCCASGSCLQQDGTFGLHCAHSGIAPTSLIEMSLDNPSHYGPYDDYDVSLVDGWSVPLSIQPVRGTYNPEPDPGVTAPWCTLSGCYAAPECPPSLAVQNTSLSCFSPCQAAVNAGNNTKHEIDRACCVCTQSHPQCDCKSSTTWGSFYYGCCEGSFGCTPYHTPQYPQDEVCDPWSTVPGRGWNTDQLNYIATVRSACNQVYSWQFDDKAASFNCRRTGGVVDYDVVFVTRFRDEGNKQKPKQRNRRN